MFENLVSKVLDEAKRNESRPDTKAVLFEASRAIQMLERSYLRFHRLFKEKAARVDGLEKTVLERVAFFRHYEQNYDDESLEYFYMIFPYLSDLENERTFEYANDRLRSPDDP